MAYWIECKQLFSAFPLHTILTVLVLAIAGGLCMMAIGHFYNRFAYRKRKG